MNSNVYLSVMNVDEVEKAAELYISRKVSNSKFKSQILMRYMNDDIITSSASYGKMV